MKRVIGAAVAAVALLSANAAAAAVQAVNFTVSGDWFGTGSPFGLAAGPDRFGTLYIDNDFTGAASIVGIDWVTGTRTWTVGDIDPANTFVQFWKTTNTFQSASINFTTPSNFIGGGAAQIRDGSEWIACNSCVVFQSNFTGVPEPTTWAMLIVGFGMAGSALRRPSSLQSFRRKPLPN